MKLERSENVKKINGYLKDNCRFQLDSIAEDSIYRDITATGRTYLYKNHSFEYDKNGNMLYENTARKHKNNVFEDKTSEVKYRWDEDNRLLGVDENGFVSHYFYDANGERALKVLFGNEGRYINSMPDTISFSTEMSAVTLYISPYFVANNNHEFTKHIYMGGERIVSKICDPQNYGSRPTNETPAFNTLFTSYYTAKRDSIESCIESNYRYFGVPYAGGYDMEPEEVLRIGGGDIGDFPQSVEETQRYFYNKDHLGSSTYITDKDGNIVQHLEYLPYGEVFIDKSFNDDYTTPYKFNGKELDEETGLYYYGARYLHPKYAMWLSTDPLEGKSPDVSSYTFCHNNPIVLIDPAGLDDWDINLQGEIVNRIENTKRDAFFIVDNKGKRLRGKELIFSYGTIERQWKNSFKHKGHYDIYKVRGDNFGNSLFEFFANNTSVEWTHFMLGKSGDQGLNLLITSHQALSEEGGGDMANNVLIKGYTIREHRHNHPSGSDIPSGLPGTILPNGSNGKADIQFASSLNSLLRKRNARAPQYKIYVKNGKYIEYTEFSIPSDFGREPNGTPVIEIGEVEIIGTNKK